MDGMMTLAEHPESAAVNGIMPTLNGIGLGVQVTMSPQHAAALMHHLSAGGAMPLSAPGGILKIGKTMAVRDGPTVLSSNHVNGTQTVQNQTQQTNQSGALIPIETTNGGSSSGRSTPNNDSTSSAKLFVGGLSWTTSSEKLRQYFSMFGSVSDVLIMRDPITQRSRGFGFITFAEADTVEKVLKVPIHTLDGKKIDPKHATPKNRPKPGNRTKKIFVGGVSQDTSAEEVKTYFSQFGKVEETVMLMDQQTKRHRGFGFVTFENEEVVDRICDIHFHTIKNKKVECKKAQPKELIQPSLLLGKRMIMGPLGVRVGPQTAATAIGPVSQFAAVQAQAQAQAAVASAVAAQNAAAAATYGKLIGTYPSLASYRYSPYPVAAISATPASVVSTTAPTGMSGSNAAASTAAMTAASYPAPYSLANVDMSSFQGIDWASMYGMGMYV